MKKEKKKRDEKDRKNSRLMEIYIYVPFMALKFVITDFAYKI